MPRGIRKKARQYVLDRFQEEDPESYFKYKMHSGLNQNQMELLQAVTSQSVRLVKSHLNNGVDPNFTVVPGRVTPLHIAVKNYADNQASETILRALLFFGANTEAADTHGNTPLHEACKGHSLESVQLLIEAGADLNSHNNMEETPLITTCRFPSNASYAIAEVLLSSGAITIMTNSFGQTALHILSDAVSSDPTYEMIRHEIALLLMRQGLRADEEDKKGKTPLSYELLHMARCSTNATLNEDLRNKITGLEAVTGTAISLVQGGAMHTSLHTKEMEAFLNTVVVHSDNLMILTSFLGAIRNFVSPSMWKRISRMVSRATRNDPQVGVLHPDVPSLAQLSKVSIRSTLRGNVIPKVELLSVPEKVKTYIISED